jgi:hypothetical protein
MVLGFQQAMGMLLIPGLVKALKQCRTHSYACHRPHDLMLRVMEC